MSKRWTPGPWKVFQTTIHGKNYGGCWVEPADREQFIQINGGASLTKRVIDRQVHDDNDANAALIAAAPELYEALEPFAKEAEQYHSMCLGQDIDHWPVGDDCMITLGDLRKAAAACRKARGEQ